MACHIGDLLNPRGDYFALYTWHSAVFDASIANLRLVVYGGSKATTEYHVSEFPNDFGDGCRSFHFAILRGSSDSENQGSYDVLCGRDPQDRRCDCKGFERTSQGPTAWCKHVLFCLELISKEQQWDEEELACARQAS